MNKPKSELEKDKVGDRAIVIGGGIAGMLAARVLADRFASVTIIEPDKLPENPDVRKGVPQSVQPHILLTKGYRILAELFPGIDSQLSAAGGLTIDWAQEFHHFGYGGWSAIAASSNIISFTCTRPLLEWAIRQQLSNFSNVQFFEKRRVTGLLSNSKRITGVCIRSTGSDQEHLPAALVVDASGRHSQAPKWLESLGFTPPSETVVDPFLGYATRRYREPNPPRWKVMLISQSPPNGTRLGYLARIEGGEWIATLGGYGRDFPPLDNEGFLDFARSLPSQRFYEAIQHAEPVLPIYAHRATANRLRHYEKVTVPEGFVCLGDAVCALCPVYGQGMTVSALSVIILRDWLNDPRSQLADGSYISSRFQSSLAKNNSLHWALATAQDSRFLTTQGRKLPGRMSKLMTWYTKRLLLKTNSDPSLHTTFIEVAHLLKSPLALYHPSVVLRVLRRNNQSKAII